MIKRDFKISEIKNTERQLSLFADELLFAETDSLWREDKIKIAINDYINSSVELELRNKRISSVFSISGKLKNVTRYGYYTIYDLYKAERINGVSSDVEELLKREVNKIENEVRKKVRLKLNLDNKNELTTNVICAIFAANSYNKCAEFCKKFRDDHLLDFKHDLKILEKGFSFWKWFFRTNKTKNRVNDTYKKTISFFQSEEFEQTKNYLSDLEYHQFITNYSIEYSDKAWKDFSENPILYQNIIEKIRPDLFSTEEEINKDISSELLDTIKKEDIDLNGFKYELRKYQEYGVKYIIKQQRVLLGDEMGLGKTVQAVAAIVSLYNKGASRFFVLCPTSVMENWCREINKMCDIPVRNLYKADYRNEMELWMTEGGIAITTYNMSKRVIIKDKNFKFDMLVVDEAHYVKNPNAQRTKNTVFLSGYTDRVLYMTGTALENKLDEMISLIRMLKPEIADKIENYEAILTEKEFKTVIEPVYYRRKREDVLAELPDLIENQEWCVMSPAEEEKYEQDVLSGDYFGCRRVSWNIDDIKESSKIKRLLELIDNAKNENRKVIVFSFFIDTIKKVKEVLGDKALTPITGSVSAVARQNIIDEFEKSPDGTVLISQIVAGGTGLNIQAASVVILCEPQFKPSTENQAISRAYRMGQTRNVMVFRLLCENTIEEGILDILKYKQELFDTYADRSSAADKDMDKKMTERLMANEYQRISSKYNKTNKNSKIENQYKKPDRIIENKTAHTIVIDTETTGVKSYKDELLQVSIIDYDGNTLYNSYFKPRKARSWDEAEKVNHISPAMVDSSPYIDEEIPKIQRIVSQAKVIVGYNTQFDIGFLKSAGLNIPVAVTQIDVMRAFAPIYGEWNSITDDYKWQKLITCAKYYGYNWPGDAHDSLQDCLATLYCYKKMNNSKGE